MKSEPGTYGVFQEKTSVYPTDVDVGNGSLQQIKVLLFRIPLLVGKVVLVMINPKFRWEVQSD